MEMNEFFQAIFKRAIGVILISNLLFLYAPLAAQTFSGVVRDAGGVPIAYATVVATGCHENEVLAYTTTNEQGGYQLMVKTDCDSLVLTARSLGFSAGAFKFSTNSTPDTCHFELRATVLQEVLIRAKTLPVVIRKDTTEFNAASFSDSTEVSVEDLLKKLPGIRVSNDGRISYNGKYVERVMIEGDDLFNQNYHIATRNIRADMIQKIQVIDKFEENPLLQGVQESDRMAINLKIKPERKRTLSGSTTGGLGYGDHVKARGHTNLFSLSRKDKTYLIGSANNTGVVLANELSFSDRFDAAKQSLQQNPLQSHKLLQSAAQETVGLPGAYTVSNCSNLLFLGEVLPVSAFFKVKITGLSSQNQLSQVSSNMSKAFLPSGILEVSEEESLAQKLQNRYLQTEMDYFSPNKNHALRGFFKIGTQPIQSIIDILRTQTGAPDNVLNDRINGTTRDAFASVEYTLKLKRKSVLQLIGKSAWNTDFSLLTPNYKLYPEYFGVDSAFTMLRQNAKQNQQKSMFAGRLLGAGSKWKWQMEAGAEVFQSRITSDVELENPLNQERILIGNNFINNIKVVANSAYLDMSVSRKFGRITTQARLHERFQTVETSDPSIKTQTLKRWAAEPMIWLRYEWNTQTTFVGTYRYRQDNPDVTRFLSQNLFVNYQAVQRGLASPDLIPGHTTNAHFHFINRDKQFNWNIGGAINATNNQFGIQYQIDPFFSVQERFRPVNTEYLTLNTSASKFLRNINCRIELGLNWTKAKESARINSTQSSLLKTDLRNLSYSFGTAFNTWVNVIIEGNAGYIRLKNADTEHPVKTVNLHSTCQLNIRPSKQFDAKFFVHQVANRLDDSAPYRYFIAMDGIINYRLPKWRSAFELSAFNLLGQKQFAQVTANSFYTFSTSVQAVNAFLVLAWDYRF